MSDIQPTQHSDGPVAVPESFGRASNNEDQPTGQEDSRDTSNSRTLEPTQGGTSVALTIPRTSPDGPTRVPGTYPPEWLPDNETDTCMSCNSPFTLIKRRHHCRSCGKIFCSDCCKLKAKLLYLDNKEARVCSNCHMLIERTLSSNHVDTNAIIGNNAPAQSYTDSRPSTSRSESCPRDGQPLKVQGVLKTGSSNRAGPNDSQNASATASDQQMHKQVMFSDGIRPGTDLSEAFPYPVPSTSSSESVPSPFSLLTRQSKDTDGKSSSRKSGRKAEGSARNITLCDDLGYLPPIIITKNMPIAAQETSASSSNPLTDLIVNHFKSFKNIHNSMESRSCPLNGAVKFEEISSLVGIDNTVTFLLLKDFYLKVKIIEKTCCIDAKLKLSEGITKENIDQKTRTETNGLSKVADLPLYWCFASDGLFKFGQSEIVLIIDKDKNDPCIPRDVFKIYLTLHELSFRRQSFENLGNLLFQDGLFGNRDTAGLVFVRPLENHCLKNVIITQKDFLVALILQRWEVPWSKVFPMRLLLGLGHKFDVYPYPLISFRVREPIYYEVGHTIISILGDFRNFRYSITHVDGLKVMLNKATRKVVIQLNQSNYQQFNKVLDSSNNEHVLAWSSCPFPEADGHLVSVQNEDSQYETVEFYKKSREHDISFKNLETGPVLGASFVIFSGALKVNQSGQSAKISIVEDGLLIQIQSCTMSALRNAIHFMHHFDIDCESNQDPLNRVEIEWLLDNT